MSRRHSPPVVVVDMAVLVLFIVASSMLSFGLLITLIWMGWL